MVSLNSPKKTRKAVKVEEEALEDGEDIQELSERTSEKKDKRATNKTSLGSQV